MSVGSDDAKAPHFPVEVLGSCAEAPADALGIYNKRKALYRPVTAELAAVRELISSVSSASCFFFSCLQSAAK